MAKKQASKLDQQLAGYATDLKAMINVKPKQFDTATIATMISALPQRKWNAAQAVVHATIAKKQADNQLKVVKALKMATASAKREDFSLPNVADRVAWVDNQKDVQFAEVEAINAEAELTAAKLGYECLDDLFTAGKKIMNWLTDQDRQQREFDRFNNEGRRNSA